MSISQESTHNCQLLTHEYTDTSRQATEKKSGHRATPGLARASEGVHPIPLLVGRTDMPHMQGVILKKRPTPYTQAYNMV